MGRFSWASQAVRFLYAPLRVVASAVGFALAALALATSLLLALSQGWQRERLTRAVEWGAERALGRTLRIGALRGPLVPELELEALELGPDPSAPEALPALALDWLSIELEPGALSRGELDVVRLQASGLRAALALPTAAETPEPERSLSERLAALALPVPPLPLRIRRLELSDLELQLLPAVEASGSSSGGPLPGAALAAALSLEGGELALPWSEDTTARAELRARGQLHAAQLEAPLPPSADFEFELALAGGRVSLARAELRSARGAATLRGAEVELASWLEGRGLAELEWELGVLRIDAPELTASASGRGDLERVQQLEVEASAPDLSLFFDRAKGEAPIGGSLALRARAQGAFASPELALEVEGPVAVSSAALRTPRASRRGWLELVLASHSSLPPGTSGPELRGTLALRGLVLPDLAIDALNADFDTRAENYAFRVRATARGSEWLYAELSLPRAPLARSLAASSQDTAALARRLLADPRSRAQLRTAELDLAALERWLPESARTLSGRARAELTLQGAPSSPLLAGRFDLRGSALLPGTPVDSLSVQLATERASYTLSALANAGERQWLSGSAALPCEVIAAALAPRARGGSDALRRALLADSRSRAELRSSELDLALAKPFLPRELQALSGRARFELRANGASPEPQLAGWLELDAGSLPVPLLHQSFEPIRGRVELVERALVIRRFELGSARGSATLDGRIALVGFAPESAALTLSLDHFALSRNTAALADVSGHLTLAGPLDSLALRGELGAEAVSVNVKGREDPALREIRVLAATLEPEAAEQIVEGGNAAESRLARALAAASVDVALAIPPQTWLRGGGAELEVEGRLALRREPGLAAVLLGSANTIRGRYELQRNRFRVRRGAVSFDGAPGLDPLVDVEAVRRIGDTELIVRLRGRLSAPEPSFTSDPPLSQDEVLSLMLFGRRASELESGEASSVQGMAASLAAGVAFQELGGEGLGDFLPVDTFDVGFGDEEQGPSLEVGKYLTERIFVSVGQSVSRRTGTRARAELSLSEHWSVQTELSSESSSGADLEWSFEY